MATLVATGQITIIDTNDLPAVATAVGDGVTKRFLYRGPTVTINDSVSYRVLATPTHYSVVTGTPDVAVFVTAPEKGALLTGVSSLASTEKSHVYYSSTTPTGGTYYDGDIWVDTINPQMVLYRYNGVTWVLASGTDYLNTLYTNIADDNILSAGEKPRVYIDWEAAKAEKITIDQRISAYGVESSAFITAYNNLYNMMSAIDYTVMTTDSIIVGTTWRTNWTAYYTTKADLLTRLATASVPRIDGVITSTLSSLTVNANNGTTFTASAATFDGHGFVPGDKVMLTGQGTDDGIYTVAYTSTGSPASYINSSSVATSGPSESGTITLPSNAYNHAPNPANVATISATPLVISGTYYGIFSGLSGSATAGTIYTTFGVVTDSSTGSTLTVAVDYTINGTTWYPMGAGNSGTAGLYTDTVSPLTISAAVSGATLSSTAVRFTVMSRRHKSWNSDTSTFDFIYDSTEALVQSVYFYTTGTGNSSWSFTNKKSVTDQSVWAVTYGTAYGTRKWIASVSSGGDITLLTDTGEVPTSGTGTVTSVTAGAGLTQSGTSTVNPTIDVVSHAGTAGSVGTLTITADSVGVNLGTTNITAYPGHNPSGFTTNVGTVTSVAALTLGTTGTDLSSSVASGSTAAVITLNVPTASASNRGALSSTDWSTFSGKQDALNGTLDATTLNLGTSTATSINLGTASTTQTINIGTGSGVTTINLGGSGDTVNIAGTLTYINTTDITVTDKLIVLNKGGGIGSGGVSGISIEELVSTTPTIVGYAETTSDRLGWIFKSPASYAFTLNASALGADRIYTLPNAAGTLALTSDLPTVNNGTLTLAVSGTGLSGSGSFTANQSGASSFTVTSNATDANTASTIVARDSAGAFSMGALTADGRLFNAYKGANSDGSNTWIGGGGQSSVGEIGATYKGSYNSAMGQGALQSNTTGYQNSAMGMQALQSNTTGYQNSAMGQGALYYNTTGFYNSAMGVYALLNNSTGYYNSAMGVYAL